MFIRDYKSRKADPLSPLRCVRDKVVFFPSHPGRSANGEPGSHNKLLLHPGHNGMKNRDIIIITKTLFLNKKPMANFYVYFVTNKKDGTLYTGLSNELERRIPEHKNKVIKGFTAKYNLDKLVYFEEYETYSEAFVRERRLKRWKRQWKFELIEKMNPEWKDLAEDWC